VTDRGARIKIYGIIILPAVLCGCKTWSLTFKKGKRGFENKTMWKMFATKVEELIGSCQKQYYLQLLHNWSPPQIITGLSSGRGMSLAGN
jgi:hypothetical protein